MQAPKFKIKTVATKRTVGVPHSSPSILLLLFHDYESRSIAREVNMAVRALCPDSERVVVASVVDLSVVPFFMRGVAKIFLEQVYKDAAQQIPEQYDPADYLMLLPDWEAKIYRRFGVFDSDRKPHMVVIDGNGQMVSHTRGRKGLPINAVEVLQKLLTSS